MKPKYHSRGVFLPQPLNLPFAKEAVIQRPSDVNGTTSKCGARAQLVRRFNNRVVSVPDFHEVWCQRMEGHAGMHVAEIHRLRFRRAKVRAATWSDDQADQ